jgi:hypothetical protein
LMPSTIGRGQIAGPALEQFRPDGLRSKMIRKLKSGQYRLYSRKTDPRTGRHRNLGTFATLEAAKKHERAVQYFKRGGH